MKSVITPQEMFAKIERPEIQRSTFNRSHGWKGTFNAGNLIPCFVDEALPGDTMKLRATIFSRLATPIKPIMDNIFMDIHFFSVPIRLVWENWQRFNGEQDNPGDTTDYLMPIINSAAGFSANSNYDYLGLPTQIAGLEVRADFLRAINLIWNEWYRDENLQNSVPVPTGDGPDNVTLYESLLPRGKRKDYFTSALPFAQKADPVSIPIGGTAPVNTNLAQITLQSISGSTNQTLRTESAGSFNRIAFDAGLPAATPLAFGTQTGLVTDLSTATAATINQLREAFQIQRMFEKDARGGTRYIELILAHFGVRSPDARLQRPEYLGGGTAPVNMNPIAQTSNSTVGNTPQGNLSAIGITSMGNKGFTKSFTEHEIIIGFLSARADLNYQDGINRMWSRKTRFDHFWPTLAHLGEQAILNKEIYAQGTSVDDEVWGYQERYAEYRYKPSTVTGLFRSNVGTSLDFWHLSQDFAALPNLNAGFIEEDPPMDRILAVPSEPDFIADAYFHYECTRPMPTYATPGLIDHF